MIAINKLKKPQSEEEIKSYWKYTDRVYISCICITYNQEIYIKDAIDSMLAQQTEYRFEIVIHDDCSSDKTREIICAYKEKYPTIIKLILQKENQYSKNPRIIPLTIPYLEGEFITICEGDDFWIDETKLQKQISSLIKSKEVHICFTAAKTLASDGSIKVIAKQKEEQIKFTLDEVVSGGGAFMPTASIMIRKVILYHLPEWYYSAPVGDYFLQIYASIDNGAIYLPIYSCIYRENSIGSWSNKRLSMTSSEIINEGEHYLRTFKKILVLNVSKDSIFPEISKKYLELSILAILSGYLSEFKYLVEKSWEYKNNLNLKQQFLYALRRSPRASRLLIFSYVYLMSKIRSK